MAVTLDWHFQQAELALAEGRCEDALAEYRRFRELLPGCAMCALFELAAAFDRMGETDSAIAYYEQNLGAPELFRIGNDREDLWRIQRRLGELYEARGDTAQAVSSTTTASWICGTMPTPSYSPQCGTCGSGWRGSWGRGKGHPTHPHLGKRETGNGKREARTTRLPLFRGSKGADVPGSGPLASSSPAR